MPRLTDVASYGVPMDGALDDATQSFDELELVVVEVEADGTAGLGFTYTIGEGGSAIHEFVDATLRPLVEEGPAAPRAAREHLRAGTTFVGREGVSELAIAAVDIALWDALGRRAGTPLYELLGGERERVPAYQTHGGWLQHDVETLVANAEAAAADGFEGFKMKVGRGHAEDSARVRAVREALPEDVGLMLDANCAFTVPEARRLVDRLDVPVDWLEEPLPKGDLEGHADLRDRIDVPVALGENCYDEAAFKGAVAAGAADVLQPDVCRVGGITAWTTVARTAAAWGLPVVPHYVEPLHVHLACASATVPYIERHSTVLETVVASPPPVEDGTLRPPAEPGHGIRFAGLESFRER